MPYFSAPLDWHFEICALCGAVVGVSLNGQVLQPEDLQGLTSADIHLTWHRRLRAASGE